MTHDYTFTLDGSKIVAVHDENAREVILDPASIEYERFVNWLRIQDSATIPVSYRSIQRGLLFCDAASVVNYCKENGVTLHVEDSGAFDVAPSFVLEHSHLSHVRTSTADKAIAFLGVFAAVASHHDPKDEVALQRSKDFVFYVSHALLQTMQEQLKLPDSDFRKLSSLQVEKTFVYLDVSGFSQHPTGYQLLIINSLIRIANSPAVWRTRNLEDVFDDLQDSICIGDGYIFVFAAPHLATFFAAYLANLIELRIAREKLIDFHFRISVHTGPVFRFWDRGKSPDEGRWNYIGKGITEGQRVLEAVGKDTDDVVYISAETRSRIRAMETSDWKAEALEWLSNRGRHLDKHGGMRRLYEVNHTSWMNNAGLGPLD